MNSGKFLLKYLEKAIDGIQEKDVYEYVELLNLYNKIINPEENIDDCLYVAFQKYFCSYYKVDRPELPFKDSKEFFGFFRHCLNFKGEDIGNIINKINESCKEGEQKVYFSFATKVLATIDVNLPIYDSKVGIALGLGGVSGSKYEVRIKCASRRYEELCHFYQDATYGSFRIECVKGFNKKFKKYKGIPDIKKIDFVLWRIGGLLQ